MEVLVFCFIFKLYVFVPFLDVKLWEGVFTDSFLYAAMCLKAGRGHIAMFEWMNKQNHTKYIKLTYILTIKSLLFLLKQLWSSSSMYSNTFTHSVSWSKQFLKISLILTLKKKKNFCIWERVEIYWPIGSALSSLVI